MFDHIILEPEQKELLFLIVEASRNVKKNNRMKFLVIESEEGDIIFHDGIKGGKSTIYAGDVDILANAGLINLGFGSQGSHRFDIKPIGFKYYSYLKAKSGEPIKNVENSIFSYFNSEPFIAKYKTAFEKWSNAQDLLWAADYQHQLTTIGHLCRESIQEFTDILIGDIGQQGDISDKAKTVARLKKVIAEKREVLPKTIFALLDALIIYWGCVSDIVQRQEHGGTKEGEDLTWEDARRVVFNTLIVMFEIDNVIGRD